MKPSKLKSTWSIPTNPLHLFLLALYAPFMIVAYCIAAIVGIIPIVWDWLWRPRYN